MICAWSAVTGLCGALAIAGFAENIRTKVTVVRARCSLGDIEGSRLGYIGLDILRFDLFLDAKVHNIL
jgi:hypothetical protein